MFADEEWVEKICLLLRKVIGIIVAVVDKVTNAIRPAGKRYPPKIYRTFFKEYIFFNNNKNIVDIVVVNLHMFSFSFFFRCGRCLFPFPPLFVLCVVFSSKVSLSIVRLPCAAFTELCGPPSISVLFVYHVFFFFVVLLWDVNIVPKFYVFRFFIYLYEFDACFHFV